MRLNIVRARKATSQVFNFVFRQRRRLSIEADEADGPWKLQHPKTILQRHPHKDVTREQDKREFFAAILPPPHRSIERQEAGNSLPIDAIGNLLFVAGSCVERIPL